MSFLKLDIVATKGDEALVLDPIDARIKLTSASTGSRSWIGTTVLKYMSFAPPERCQHTPQEAMDPPDLEDLPNLEEGRLNRATVAGLVINWQG